MPTDERGRRDEPVVEISQNGETVVVRLAGELDLYNAAAVRRALLGALDDDPERVVIDLTQVEFMDSTALAVLVEARARLAKRERFVLASPGLETHRALAISGLDRHFVVHASVDDALAAPL